MKPLFLILSLFLLSPLMAFAETLGDSLTDAASQGDISKLQRLLAQKNVVDTKDQNGWTALMTAAQKGHLEVVKLLLDQRANVNAKAWLDKGSHAHAKTNADVTALMIAAENGQAEAAKLLLAAEKGHDQVVKALLDKGAAIEAKREDNCNSLILAAQNGCVEVVKILIAKKADLNAEDMSGDKALAKATAKEYSDVIDILKQAGAK